MTDLFVLDAQVARAHASTERDLASLSTKEGRELARVTDPFTGVREVAGQATFRSLETAETLALDHRSALQRWVYELLQLRVGRELLLDEADAIHAIDDDAPNEPTFDAARRALIEAPHVALADQAYRRLSELAPAVAAVRKELRARRVEAASRLDLAHPWALFAPASNLASLARSILDATEPLARELCAAETVPQAIHDAFGRDAHEGWPAHLAKRWLDDVFRAIAARPPTLTSTWTPLGGASFVRAAEAWGRALRHAAVPRSLPFALARDPYPTEAWTFGGTLAAAVADRVFAKRKLGLTARAADAHTRALGRVLFRTLRGRAAEVLASLGAGDETEELTARLFGRPLTPALGSIWSTGGFSGASRLDAPARLAGAIRAFDLFRTLVDRFDEDWFDNPRAGVHLASIGGGPIHRPFQETEVELVPVLARTFEEKLG
jgi:hypothetical protein